MSFLNNKILYYKETISEDATSHLASRRIPGLSEIITVELGGPPTFARTLKHIAPPAGGRRKQTRRNLKKNRRKSRKH